MRRRIFIGTLLLLWIVAAAVSWRSMLHFATTPGEQAVAPNTLPAILRSVLLSDGRGPLEKPRKQLFVVLHPQCSCSTATMRELVRIVSQNRIADGLQVNLLVYKPLVIPAHWSSSPALPNIAATLHPKVIFDTEGGYAWALGARTSGEVILYSEAGRLLMQGGITPERGHEGASEGGTRLLKALQTGTVEKYFTAVFGCPIFARAGELAR